MAASFKIMSSNVIIKLSRLFVKQGQSKLHLKWNKMFRCNPFKNNVLLSLIPVATVLAGPDSDSDKPFEPNDARLRSSECLKNAAGLAVDSTSAVLSQTVYAIVKVEKEYVELLNVLATLLEYQMQVLDQKAEEERIADIILETRHEINKVKKRKQDLALLFASVEKLADATAEVAFATGSNYASTSAGERLYSAQQEIKRNWLESEKAERDVAHVEAQLIERITRHEREKAERSKREVRLADELKENEEKYVSESESEPHSIEENKEGHDVNNFSTDFLNSAYLADDNYDDEGFGNG